VFLASDVLRALPADAALVLGGCDDRDVAQRAQFLVERGQPGRVDAVVVRQEDLGHR
jgi:hypothetical protein